MLNQKAQKCVLAKSSHAPKKHTDQHEEQIKQIPSLYTVTEDGEHCQLQIAIHRKITPISSRATFWAPSQTYWRERRGSEGERRSSVEERRGKERKITSRKSPLRKKKSPEENPDRWEHGLQRKELEVYRPPSDSPERQHFWGRRG